MKIDLDPDKIREDVVSRCVGEVLSDFDYQGEVSDRISNAVDKKMQSEIDALAEKAMNDALDHALRQQVTPVDIWGQKTGEPKTLQAAIHEKARNFWLEKVGNNGRQSAYGGTPRYEYLLKDMVKEEFHEIIKDNLHEVVAGMKEAIRSDLKSQVDKNLDVFLKVNNRR